MYMYNMILHTSLQELRQNITQRLWRQKIPHTSPVRASYGVSFMNILEKTDRIITALHCILNFHLPLCSLWIHMFVVVAAAWALPLVPFHRH